MMTAAIAINPKNPFHTFHIPVMGTGFSIDTPIKVAKYGISSVISLVDDTLIEYVRKFYCEKFGEPYIPITKDDEDYRARRITEYLNLVDRIVKRQFSELRASVFELGSEITKYFELLPDYSPLKKLYAGMLGTQDPALKKELQRELREQIQPGDINVNIMTKLDRPYFDKDGNPLADEYSDALAALRGFAKSVLSSAIVFSAGFNRRLYSYIEQFNDFYADASGSFKKRIVLKVSDFRSALTQGKFLAKKGLWISEYRIESGLNCGGHVFPAAGELMGPILEEFRAKKEELIATLHEVCSEALKLKERMSFAQPHPVRITAQGGIGTVQEHHFLIDYYKLDSAGWGTPFLICPEVTNVDGPTLEKLAAATEEDLYTSDVSPLGVPFNNLRGSLSDLEKDNKMLKGRPGSACPKGHLVSNTEFTKEPICTASRLYQKRKLDQLSIENQDPVRFRRFQTEIIKKACICNDLGEGFLLKNSITNGRRPLFPAVCPGPNMAYFSRISTLREMADHIYGRGNVLNGRPRPHMFVKELLVNLDFLKKEAEKFGPHPTEKDRQYLDTFKANLLKGIEYYRRIMPEMGGEPADVRGEILHQMQEIEKKILEKKAGAALVA